MLLRKARLTLPAIVFLVLLRITIGWHFFQEGVTKVRDGNFSSTPFLAGAKGPFAKQFQAMIPDYDGSIRIDDEKMTELSSTYLETAATEFGFTGEQKKEAEEILGTFKAKRDEIYFTDEQRKELAKLLKDSSTGRDAINRDISEKKIEEKEGQEQLSRLESDFDEKRDEILSKESPITEFRKGIERVKNLEQDSSRSGVESLRKQRDEIETKWRALGRPILAEIDQTVQEMESQINALATDEQAAPDPKKPAIAADGKPIRKRVEFKYPGEGKITVRQIDKIIPIFDMAVGILLFVGLLTPIAGLAAGLFLVSVVVSQFPGFAGSQPTYYQAIEMLACFLLAFADAGRYAGLDFIPWSFWNRNAKAPVEA